MSKSVSLQILVLKLVKLDCIIIDTIKQARNELDRACGFPLVIFVISCSH